MTETKQTEIVHKQTKRKQERSKRNRNMTEKQNINMTEPNKTET